MGCFGGICSPVITLDNQSLHKAKKHKAKKAKISDSWHLRNLPKFCKSCGKELVFKSVERNPFNSYDSYTGKKLDIQYFYMQCPKINKFDFGVHIHDKYWINKATDSFGSVGSSW